MKIAIADIGSNTIRGEAYELMPGKRKLLFSQKNTAGLIGYVKEGRLNEEGVRLLLETLERFQAQCLAMGVTDIRPFATASLRAAANAPEIAALVGERLGLSLRLLSGEEEARMDYAGLLAQFPEAREGLLADVGGGSSQLVRFSGGRVTDTVSLPLGSLSLHKHFILNVLPGPDELAALSEHVRKTLNGVPWLCGLCGEAWAMGGSARGLARAHMAWKGTGAPPAGYALPMRDVDAMLGLTPHEWLGLLLSAAPDRVHTLLPGAVILRAVFAGQDCVRTVTSGVREGFLASLSAVGV